MIATDKIKRPTGVQGQFFILLHTLCNNAVQLNLHITAHVCSYAGTTFTKSHVASFVMLVGCVYA